MKKRVEGEDDIPTPKNFDQENDKNIDTEQVESQEKENDTHMRYNLRLNRKLNYLHRFALLSVHVGVRKWED